MVERSQQELNILERVSQILGEGLVINQVLSRALEELSRHTEIVQAALLLRDDTNQHLRIVASVGLPAQQTELRASGLVGARIEQVVQRVLATGNLQLIPDISQPPGTSPGSLPGSLPGTPCGTALETPGSLGSETAALGTPEPPGTPGRIPTQPHWTGLRASLVCIPIRASGKILGALAVVKPLTHEAAVAADVRLLMLVAALMAQTLRIHHLFQLEKEFLHREAQHLRENLHVKYHFDNIVGSSPAMVDILTTIGRISDSRSTCLLVGEPGVGKELVARAIHFNSPRRDKPMIRVNCSVIAPHLLESELFGQGHGGPGLAVKDTWGRFSAADGGTIFLDEVTSLDPALQTKLLHVLQHRQFERVGDHQTIAVDVRVIATTTLDLEQEVRNGAFREDLYCLLNVVAIHVPPLRSRREDIPALIDHFLDRFNRENNRNLRHISRDVLDTLCRYPWPGNVRELKNTIERAVVLSKGEEFTEDLLPLQIRLFAYQNRGDAQHQSVENLARRLASHAVQQYRLHDGKVYELVVDQVEKRLITEALALTSGIKTRAADFLGINRNTLNKKVKDLDIQAMD